jgi:hypothetical protein
MYMVIHECICNYCTTVVNLQLSWQIFKKKSPFNIIFHEHPSGGISVVPCGQTDRRTDGQTYRHDSCSSRFSGVHNAFVITVLTLPETVTSRWHKNIFCCTKLSPQYVQETVFLSGSFTGVPKFESVWTLLLSVNNWYVTL